MGEQINSSQSHVNWGMTTVKLEMYGKSAFESAAGSGVNYIRMETTLNGLMFVFTGGGSWVERTVLTKPNGSGRVAIEAAARDAGRMAATMTPISNGSIDKEVPY